MRAAANIVYTRTILRTDMGFYMGVMLWVLLKSFYGAVIVGLPVILAVAHMGSSRLDNDQWSHSP